MDKPIYIYKSNIYRIVRETRFKHPQTREWLDAVVYTCADKENGEWFVREKTEFFDRFKEVQTDENI